MKITLPSIHYIILPVLVVSIVLIGSVSGNTIQNFNPQSSTKIVLQIYDNDGMIINGYEMNLLTNGELYLTDPNDLPHYSVYDPSQELPTFRVLPGRAYKIHFLWEVPEFGKIMLLADNEGKGYSVENEGEQILLNLNYEVAKSNVASLDNDYYKYNNQGISMSESVFEGLNSSRQHLTSAEDYLSETPSPDIPDAIKELNQALKYALLAHEQLCLDKAQADIEMNRKGDVIVKVVDQSGQPLPDVEVTYTQTSHDFIFSVTGGLSPTSLSLLKEAKINYTLSYFFYGVVEPQLEQFDWTSTDGQVNSQLRNGFNSIGNLSWLFFHGWGHNPAESYLPEYIKNLNFEDLKKAVFEHMYTIVDRYKDEINIWEALYEVCNPWSNELRWTWSQRLEVFKEAANAIKTANPNAKIRIKDEATPYNHFMAQDVCEPMDLNSTAGWIPLQEFITITISREIPIDILGLLIPSGAVDIYQTGIPNIHPLMDIFSISSLLDNYAQFGKQIMLESFNAPSTQIKSGCWWHQPWDEQVQADYTIKVFTIAFSKPLSIGIDWEVITDDESEKIGGLTCGLLDSEQNPKPVYYALKDLISSWTTSGSGVSSQEGEIYFRGFAGDYFLVLETVNSQSFSGYIHVNEQQSNEVVVQLLDDDTLIFITPTQSQIHSPSDILSQLPESDEITSGSTKAGSNYLMIILVSIAGLAIIGLVVVVLIRRTRST